MRFFTLRGGWIAEIPDGNGNVDARITDLALVKADGTVYPWYTGQATNPGAPTLASCATSNVFAELATDDVTANPSLATRYYLHDHLGTTQVELNGYGSPVWQGQFTPFGQEIVNGTTFSYLGQQPADGTDMRFKFTGKERDTESGLDYFGARYYASTMGRFMSPDPSTESEVLRNPQTWNRYSYTLNNPLIYIDPTGEVWVSAQGGGYDWQDSCNKGQTCYNAIAAVKGNSLVVYGSTNAKDVTTIQANDKGYIDLSQVAQQHDADFSVKSGANPYSSLSSAAGFFNATEQYSQQFPGSDKFLVTDAGKADGAMFPPHKTHDLGRAVDVRYQDENGKNLQGDSAAGNADINRMSSLVSDAKGQGFNQNYSARPTDFGTKYAPGHENHIHLGKTRPPSQ